MFEVALAGIGLKIVSAVLAMLAALISLRLLDRATGFNFKEWRNGADDLSKSIYLGFRVIGVLGLFGFIFS